MKKLLCLFLAALLLLSISACGAEQEDPLAGKFAVGYGRADVTPKPGISMSGFAAQGENTRTAESVLNELYMTCIAITDSAGKTVLLYTFDAIRIAGESADTIRKAVSNATSVPVEHIMISATHSHSTPPVNSQWYSQCETGAVDAAKAALEDRAEATMEYASTELERMSFVRHYITDLGKTVGDNFYASGDGRPVSHTTEADKELRLVRFLREGKKPVLMVNWLGHASMASSSSTEFGQAHRYFLSSDYVGFCRSYVEKNLDCHFALFMGASGNINPCSSVIGEDLTKSAIEYGEKLGEKVLALATTAGTTGGIQTTTQQFQTNEGTMDINAMGIGSLGIITGPFEMFDTTSMAVRAESPFAITFVLSQTNGALGYMPTDICFDYNDCYECRNCNFARGSAEKIVGVYGQMLQTVKND